MTEDISEVYICIGYCNSVYYFIHTIHHKDMFCNTKHPIDQLMINCMIHYKLIKNYNEKCVVYTIDNNSIEVTILHHINAISFNVDQKSLRYMLKHCIDNFVKKNSNDNNIVFKYVYKKKCMEFHIIKLNYNGLSIFSDCVNLPFSKMVRAETHKPIPNK